MRFHFEFDSSRKPIREPGPLLMQVCVIPVAVSSTPLVAFA